MGYHIHMHLRQGRPGKPKGIKLTQRQPRNARNGLLQRRVQVNWLIIQYQTVSFEKHTSSIIQMEQFIARNIYINPCTYMNVTIINEKELMNLKESKEEVKRRIWKEEREERHDITMLWSQKLNKKYNSMHSRRNRAPQERITP